MFGPVVLVAFVVLCLGALVKPHWALALLLLMYPLEQGLQGWFPMFVERQALANYIVGVVVVICLFQAYIRGLIDFEGYFNPVWVTIFVAYIYSFITIIWTPATDNAWQLVIDGWPYTVMYMLIAPLLLSEIKDWHNTLVVAIVFGCVSAVAMLISPEFTLKQGRLGMDFTSKLRSSPLAIGELGGFLMLATTLLVLPGSSFISKVYRFFAFFAGVVLSIYSGSRGQFIFAGFLSVVFFPLSRPIKNVSQFFLLSFGAVGLLGVVGLVVAFLVGDPEIAMRWLNPQEADRAVGLRSANIVDLLDGFMRAPAMWLPGLGLNAFTALTGSTEPYSHSIFVDVLAEMGLVAFVIMIACLWSILRRSIQLIRENLLLPDSRSASVVMVALCAYQLLLMNKQGQLWASQNTLVYFLLLAKITAAGVEEPVPHISYTPGGSVDLDGESEHMPTHA
ncbi:MAG: hypothetical protein K8R92_07795 [Planctomycetes bacterium]|nr:hypothetical protein [Planctomycetota bacterium]